MHTTSYDAKQNTLSQRAQVMQTILEQKQSLAIQLYQQQPQYNQTKKHHMNPYIISIIVAFVAYLILSLIPSTIMHNASTEQYASSASKPDAASLTAKQPTAKTTKPTEKSQPTKAEKQDNTNTNKKDIHSQEKTVAAAQEKQEQQNETKQTEPEQTENKTSQEAVKNTPANSEDNKQEVTPAPWEDMTGELEDFALNRLSMWKSNDGRYYRWDLAGGVVYFTMEDLYKQKQLMDEAYQAGSNVTVDDVTWTSYLATAATLTGNWDKKCIVPSSWNLSNGDTILVYLNNMCVECTVENGNDFVLDSGAWRSLGYSAESIFGARHVAVKKN